MIPRRQCHGCFMPLDARAFCPRCEPAQVVCPKCSKVIKDGPNQKPNFQFCTACLEARVAQNKIEEGSKRA